MINNWIHYRIFCHSKKHCDDLNNPCAGLKKIPKSWNKPWLIWGQLTYAFQMPRLPSELSASLISGCSWCWLFSFFFFFNTEINDLTQFQYFWCAVGRRRGRTWWLSGEQLLKGSWESQKLSSAVTVWADKMGVRGSADSKAERPVHQTPEKAVTGCALRTPQARGHSTERRVPAGCALEGGVILRACSWGSTESRLPWPGALKYHSARFTKSNNGSFEWHFKIQTFYFL